ncbi:YihY/virulence factor BrkB family protein [Rhizobium sp. BK661]|uniref:YihY/virulence factor BrkB family protein n=1 Tax=Rhizobium sp. BK661 TaxID=2586991 RepID=UPI002169C2CF|nr:YihY/virulence factor BrkB family protein [Rhizobium sp. BK661]MCS3742171.1 membrane protein [Rhizobium sp. BK661]
MRQPILSKSGNSITASLFALAAGAVLLKAFAERKEPEPPSTPHDEPTDVRGRKAEVPEDIPRKGLRDVFWRVVGKISSHRITLIAAGVSFYLLLAIFPALGAVVSLYGLAADPITISDHLRELSWVLPPGAFDLIAEQIKSIVQRGTSTLGIAFFVSLAIALWSTHSGTLAVFDAMNVAYEENEKRGFVRLNLVALCFTLCAVIAALLMIFLVAIIPLALSFMWIDAFKEQIVLLMRWPVLLLLVNAASTAIYRFGPSRAPARVRWMTWGAGFTAIGWFVMSAAFAFYLNHFANYSATYGTLGALIGFLMWMWLSVVILVLGAALNAELEHQTEIDTTTGRPLPMGARGAYVADTVGEVQD